ncbi:MAG: hypothetical protein HDS18_06505 [Bacteroides sp.]|nr:hypothetical protein [Bacteroides sp.]
MSLFSIINRKSHFKFTNNSLLRNLFAVLMICLLSLAVTSCGGGHGGGSEYYNKGYHYGREYADQTVMLHINTSEYYKAEHYLSRSFAERMLDAYKSSMAAFIIESYDAEKEWDNGFVDGYMERANELVKGRSSSSGGSYSSSSSGSKSSSKGLGFKGWCIIIILGYLAYKYLKSKNTTESKEGMSILEPISKTDKPDVDKHDVDKKNEITYPVVDDDNSERDDNAAKDANAEKEVAPQIILVDKPSSEEPITYFVHHPSDVKTNNAETLKRDVIENKNIIDNKEECSETLNEEPANLSENTTKEEPPTYVDPDVLPVYEENEEIGKRTPWIVWVVVLLLLGGGVLATGQVLNWWNIPALSWIGGSGGSDVEMMAVDTDTVVEAVAEEVEIDPVVSIVPDMKILKGYIGEKYAVEMVLSGESVDEGTTHYFRPQSGKYRYTKNNGAWIDLTVEIETDSYGADNIRLKEYTNGNLTGTWEVTYNVLDDNLKGNMTNYKGDTYSVNLSANSTQSGLKEGYNKITGNVVTDSKDYPFYIDFQYENGEITNAVYHNPDYNTVHNLNVVRLSNGEYYFEGDHNGETMTITFSATAPYKGTIEVGSNIRKIKMDL